MHPWEILAHEKENKGFVRWLGRAVFAGDIQPARTKDDLPFASLPQAAGARFGRHAPVQEHRLEPGPFAG